MPSATAIQENVLNRAKLMDSRAEVHCHHCGELCADASIHADDKAFCCEGCKTVYEILRDNNLCSYYDLNEHAGISFRNITTNQRRSRFDYLDDDNIHAQLLEFRQGDVAKVRFHLPQIHCSSCLWLLEKLYKLNDGISASRVDFVQKEVGITFNPHKISLRGVVELLTTIGYEPDLRLKATNHLTAEQQSSAPNEKRSPPQAHLTSLYLKIGIAGFAFGNTMIFSFPEYLSAAGELDPRLRSFFGALSIALALPVLLYCASDYFKSSWQSLKQRHISLDVPIALGISVLFLRSVVEILIGATSGYLDSFTGLVFLLLCGKLFQQKVFDGIAFDRDYTSYFPIAVSVLRKTAEGVRETTIPLSRLGVGERLLVRNGELVPADSVLESPVGHVDYSFVTGESAPVEILRGNTLYAGGRIVGAALEMTNIKNVSQSYLTSLWNHETFQKYRKSALEQVSNRFGAYFTTFVLCLASAAFIAWMPDIGKAINAATAVLVIACPCAMTLAAPFALGWTLKIFGNAGFYLKNTSVVLELTRINTIVFDKTGTLTDANKSRTAFSGEAFTTKEQELLASALRHSAHPLARSVSAAMSYAEVHGKYRMTNYEEIPASGFRCVVDGVLVQVGTAKFVRGNLLCQEVQQQGFKLKGFKGTYRLEHPMESRIGAEVHIAIGGAYKGMFTVKNDYRRGLQSLFARLRSKYALLLLSGDNDAERKTLQDLFADDRTNMMAFHQTPHDKLARIGELQEVGAHVAMVGDGLNDAGALRQSNVGIAVMGAGGMFSPACDAVLSADALGKLSDFMRFAGYTRHVIIAAFWISVAYNIVGLTCAVMGLLSPLVSAVLMPISNATVIGFTTLAVLLGAKMRKI